MLSKESQECLVATLVLLLHAWVLEVRARCHPAVDLVAEGLDVLGALQVRLELLDVVGRLVLGGEQAERDLDLLGVGRVDHGRVALGGGGEGRVGGRGRDGDDLAAPAEPDDAPGLDVGVRLFDLL